MKEKKGRDALYIAVILTIIGGTVLTMFGLGTISFTTISSGLGFILAGALLGSLGNTIYDTRDASVKQMKVLEELQNFQLLKDQARAEMETEEIEEESTTLDWSKVIVKEWPLQITKFQIVDIQGRFWGRVELKNLAQKEIEYLEFEVEFWDYLKRKIKQEDKFVVREIITLPPNGNVLTSLFLLPHLISDAQVNLIGVRYADGEVELMPIEVERYSLPVVTPFDGSQSFMNFTSSYLEGRGFDVMPTYYYDSTPTHWNCVFCGTINEQKDNSCASCKRERQIQHFAREEFLRKKFEEESSST